MTDNNKQQHFLKVSVSRDSRQVTITSDEPISAIDFGDVPQAILLAQELEKYKHENEALRRDNRLLLKERDHLRERFLPRGDCDD